MNNIAMLRSNSIGIEVTSRVDSKCHLLLFEMKLVVVENKMIII